MHSANYLNAERIYSLHLTVQSVELVRKSEQRLSNIGVLRYLGNSVSELYVIVQQKKTRYWNNWFIEI